MIDESLIKRHSIGKDGFTWWLGQVCEAKTWEANYPELDVEKRLMELDVDIHLSRSVYNVGDIVSTQHQNISKSTCYEGNDYNVGDSWSLADWNGATNGGHYNVIFIEMSATW